MKKILVAVDFTEASKNAFCYAIKFAQQLKAELSAVHIWLTPTKELSILPDDMSAALSIKNKQVLRARLQNFCTGYPHDESHRLLEGQIIDYKIKESESVTEGILMAAEEQKADIILIGTRAKHSLKEYILGSVSTQLIGKALQCLYIIPEEVSYSPIQHIALATKINIGLYPVINELQDLAKALNAKVSQVYVETLPFDISEQHEQVMTTGWLEEAGSEFAEVTVIRDRSVVKGLDFFIKKHEVDVLCMHIPFRAPIEKWLHRSQSKKMVLRGQFPILILHE